MIVSTSLKTLLQGYLIYLCYKEHSLLMLSPVYVQISYGE